MEIDCKMRHDSIRHRVVCCSAAVLLALSFAGCTGCVETEVAEQPALPIKLVAHRGESSFAPENTIPAFELAWKSGYAYAMEIDIFQTADGVLVCSHDGNLERLTGHSNWVTNMTFEEIRQLDISKGNHRWSKDPQWYGTRIPSLREALATLPEDGHIFVEIKQGGNNFPEIFERTRVAAGTRQDQITFISYSDDELKRVVNELEYPYPTQLLLGIKVDENGVNSPTADELIARLTAIGATGADALAYDRCIDREYIKTIQDAGFEFHVWTYNDIKNAMWAIDMGVDSITTDNPSTLMPQIIAELERRKAEAAEAK